METDTKRERGEKMTRYVFDLEEKEYIEVTRPFPFIPGPNGEPPLSPVEIYKRKRGEFSRQRERAAEKKAAQEELEKAAQEAVKKAIKEIEKQIEKDLNK